MTAANADLWVPVSPPGEFPGGSGLFRAVMEGPGGSEGKGTAEPPADSIPLDQLERQTGVAAQTIRMLARKVTASQRPLFLAAGLTFADSQAMETAVAANQLCAAMPESPSLLDFGDPSSLGKAAPLQRMRELCDRMTRGRGGGSAYRYRQPALSSSSRLGISEGPQDGSVRRDLFQPARRDERAGPPRPSPPTFHGVLGGLQPTEERARLDAADDGRHLRLPADGGPSHFRGQEALR